MDDGYTIQGLNDGYTLMGAKIMEWSAGIVMAIISQEMLHLNIARSGPLFIVICLGTTFGLAALRRSFPDEERGIRNTCMVAMGLPPPGIPTPAVFQPYWSGAPLRDLNEKTYFVELGLQEALDYRSTAESGAEQMREAA